MLIQNAECETLAGNICASTRETRFLHSEFLHSELQDTTNTYQLY